MAIVLVALLTGCGAASLVSDGATALGDASEPKLGIGGDAAVAEAAGATAVTAPPASPAAAIAGTSNRSGSTKRVAAVTPNADAGFAQTVGAVAAPAAAATKTGGAMSNGFTSASAPGNSAYKIGVHDVVEVSVFQAPELSRSAQVSEAGTIGLPLVGEIQAGGRTAQEVERDLARLLKAKYMHNPQVAVFVKEFNSQRVTIEGAVKKSGMFPLRGKTSLLQAVSMADGLTDTADTSLVIFRQSEKGRMAARFDLSEIRAGTADDPQLQAGDVVVVGTSFWKEQLGNFLKIVPAMGLFALL